MTVPADLRLLQGMHDLKSFRIAWGIRHEEILCCWIMKSIMIVSHYRMIYVMKEVKVWYDISMIYISSMIMKELWLYEHDMILSSQVH